MSIYDSVQGPRSNLMEKRVPSPGMILLDKSLSELAWKDAAWIRGSISPFLEYPQTHSGYLWSQ